MSRGVVIGVEVEIEEVNFDAVELQWGVRGGFNSYWNYKRDGSLRDSNTGQGAEFVTRGGLLRSDLEIAITGLCQWLTKQRAVPSERCAIHYHMDFTGTGDTGSSTLWAMAILYSLFENSMFRFAGEWRKDCGFCAPMLQYPAVVDMLRTLCRNPGIDFYAAQKVGVQKYAALNFLTLERFGTIEFRHLPTTLDPQRVLLWIDWGLALRSAAEKFKDNPGDILTQFSASAPNFVRTVLGDTLYERLQPYIVEADLWDGAGLASAFPYRPNTPVTRKWNSPKNTVLAAKLQLWNEQHAGVSVELAAADEDTDEAEEAAPAENPAAAVRGIGRIRTGLIPDDPLGQRTPRDILAELAATQNIPNGRRQP